MEVILKELIEVPLSDIQPDPAQPRKDFEEISLNELAESIAAVGVIQAITIRKNPTGQTKYMIIAGERRWRASGIAGKDTIPAVYVDEINKDVIYQQQLTENLFRADLNPVEKAEFIDNRVNEVRASGVENAVEVVAKEIGVTASWISKSTAVLRFADELKDVVRAGKLRQYDLLKKIDSLSKSKKAEAIRQINSGEFNAKRFFARKRSKEVSSESVSDNAVVDENSSAENSKKDTAFTAKFSLSKEAFIKLVKGTDYGNIISSVKDDWPLSSDEEFKKYLEGFKDWLQRS